MRVQVINAASPPLFWDLKQCFVWVLLCRLSFFEWVPECLRVVPVCLHACTCVFMCVCISQGSLGKRLSKERLLYEEIQLSPWTFCHLIRTEQTPTHSFLHLCISLLFHHVFFFFFLSFPSRLAIFVDSGCRQQRERFDFLGEALQRCWHCLTWAGLWMGQMASALALAGSSAAGRLHKSTFHTMFQSFFRSGAVWGERDVSPYDR